MSVLSSFLYVETRPTLYTNFCCIKVGSETNMTMNTREQAINWREEERKNGPDE